MKLVITRQGAKKVDEEFEIRLRQLMLDYEINTLSAVWELFPPQRSLTIGETSSFMVEGIE